MTMRPPTQSPGSQLPTFSPNLKLALSLGGQGMPLTQNAKTLYTTPKSQQIREYISRKGLPYMTTALLASQGRQTIAPPKIADRITEKLDLELDFAKASLPARTRLTHPHILLSPIHYEPDYAYPLLVWLHGTGSDEKQLMRIMPIVSLRNYVAVAPRGLSISPPNALPSLDLSVAAILQRPKEQFDWPLSNDTDHLATIEQRIFDCIAVAQERCNVADHRIFIAGFGSGGMAALRLATLYPECFAGAAMFGSKMPEGCYVSPSWQMLQSFSVFLGVDSSESESVCRMMELFYTAGITASVQEYADAEHLTPAMLQDLNRWMMQIVCHR